MTMRKMTNRNCKEAKEKVANVWVLCNCGKEHQLIPGIDAPIYWCGDELKCLVKGDEIEYEEVRGEALW